MSISAPRMAARSVSLAAPLVAITDAVAALMLAADLVVVCASVLLRSVFNAPVEWATTWPAG